MASFRTKLFFATLSAATVALIVAGALFGELMRRRADDQIERTLTAEARLASELLSHGDPATTAALPMLDEEADRMGQLLDARVTLIAPDGQVLGDSAETLDGVRAMENHGSRPEVLDARTHGVGRARRYSSTLKIDMLYVAVPIRSPSIGFVRVALPLTS